MNCKHCGESITCYAAEQRYCGPCQYKMEQPRSYGILSGGNIQKDNPNPFVRRAAAHILPSKVLTVR